jgi:predicted RNA binding protein YcfA (HicA-like mRNA interferase family)
VRIEKRTADNSVQLTVLMHPELKPGTLVHILKDAGLSAEDFDRLA